MRFSDSFLAELKTRLPLSEVVGRRVKLRKQGREWTGLSPFSNEKTPSFFVNDEKGVYHCFSTGESGDLIGFVQKTERLSFAEAVERLAQEAGLALPDVSQSREETKRSQTQSALRDIVAQAAQYFSQTLRGPQGGGARDYLARRGLTPEAWERHKIGYAPPGWRGLIEHLGQQGVRTEQIVQAGLAVAPEQPDKAPWDRFRNRIMFSITDRAGRIIAFGGRALSEEDKPKYINSPENPLFAKGHMLYRYADARAALAAQSRKLAGRLDGLILVEGYTDAIAMAEAGFGMATAPLGTSVTERQLALIWQAGPEPVLCLDGDRAGLGAAYRVAELALPHLSARRTLNFALLPDGLDPDELIRQRGVSALGDVLAHAVALIDMLWTREWERLPADTPERRVGLQQRLDALIDRINDKPVREAYRRELRDRLFARFSEAKPGRKGVSRSSDKKQPPLLTARGSARRAGLVLLARAMESPALLDAVAETLARAHFADPDIGSIRDQVLHVWESGEEVSRDSVMAGLGESGQNRAARMLAELPIHAPLDPKSEAGCDWIRAADSFASNARTQAGENRDLSVSAAQRELTPESWEQRRAMVAERQSAKARQHD